MEGLEGTWLLILIVADELAQVLMERGLEDTFGLGWHLSCSLIIRIGDSVIIIIISRKISLSISIYHLYNMHVGLDHQVVVVKLQVKKCESRMDSVRRAFSLEPRLLSVLFYFVPPILTVKLARLLQPPFFIFLDYPCLSVLKCPLLVGGFCTNWWKFISAKQFQPQIASICWKLHSHHHPRPTYIKNQV